MVWTPKGHIPIEQIKVGQQIYTFNELIRKLEITTVSNVFNNGSAECVEIVLKTGSKIDCTPDHEILTYNGWKRASNLDLESRVVQISEPFKQVDCLEINGQLESIKYIGIYSVYDLSVPPHHNYIVDGVVVHNCGISTLTGVFALWYAMFFSHKTVLIVSKRDDDAMAFLDKNVKFVYSHLPQEFRDLYGDPPLTFNEHMIKFPNGSLVKSLTSSKDTLRSHSSSLNIIDESGFMPDMDAMWCVSPDTVLYSNGFKAIKDIEVGMAVSSPNNTNKCLVVHNKNSIQVKKITTTCGYTITAGLNHKLSSNNRMVNVKDLKKNDYLDLASNYIQEKEDLSLKTLRLPKLDCELLQFIGLILGDESVSHHCPKRLIITLGFGDVDIIKWLQQYISKLGINIHDLVEKLDRNKLITKTSARDVTVPKLVKESGRAQICAFLRGLYSADGAILNGNRKQIILSSASITLITEVQQLLLGLGMKSCVGHRISGFKTRQHILTINDKTSLSRFARQIGFIQQSKIKRCAEYQSLKGSNKKFKVRIKELNRSIIDVMDLTLSGDHLYISNGFISHNSGGYSTLMHGGHVIVVSTCVSPETYVLTSDGMRQMKDLAPIKYEGFIDGYHHAPYVGPAIYGINGSQIPTKFYRRNEESTKIIKTKCNYQIEVSTTHRLLIVRDGQINWINSTDLKLNDHAIIQRGQNLFGNNDKLDYIDDKTGFTVGVMRPDLAYLLGVITAEGSIQKHSVNISSGDVDVRQKFINNNYGLTWKERPRQKYSVDCNSSAFVRFLLFLGFELVKAPDKQIPKRLWSCSKDILRSYLQGLFDGDGHSRSRDGEVGLTSTSPKLLTQVRHILTNFGIIAREEWRDGYEKEFNLNGRSYVSKCLPHGRLIIRSGEAIKFYQTIGFQLNRKQNNRIKCRNQIEYIPNSIMLIKEFRREADLSIAAMNSFGIKNTALFGRENRKNKKLSRDIIKNFVMATELKFGHLSSHKALKSLINENFYFDEVVEILDSKSELMDFTIPVGHNFVGNSFINHQTNGMGNWYHLTWDDAIARKNEFNPIEVNWWNMDWSIEYKDEFTGQKCRIAPRDNIKECKNKEDKDRWGKFYSPWLEEQYRQLQQRGEAHLFRQEVLAEFIGTGNTVLPANVLIDMRNKIDDNYARVSQVDYTHPISSEELVLDFEDQLWLWNKPVKPTPPILENGRIIKPAEPGHSYVMGVDISSGEDNDYSAIEIIDCVTMEQVAELNIKVMPAILKLMVDYLAKYYNMAYVVPERTGLGSGVSQDIYHELGYPNVYRMRSPSGTLNRKVGFPTVPAYKPQLTKCLLDHLTEDGVYIKSRRLYGQLAIFIHYGNNRVGNVKGPGNHDDLPMSLALALIGIRESAQSDQRDLFPQRYVPTEDPTMTANPQKISELTNSGGLNCLLPVIYGSEITIIDTPEEQLRKFTNQLGGVQIKRPNAVNQRKHILDP
jgi:intein/homing endonuclease